MSDNTHFKTVAAFLPATVDAVMFRELPHTPQVKAFESYLRGIHTQNRIAAIASADCAQLEIERLSTIVQAMQDALRHHRSNLPRECCGGCTTAACVDGRTFTVPADAVTLIDGEVG